MLKLKHSGGKLLILALAFCIVTAVSPAGLNGGNSPESPPAGQYAYNPLNLPQIITLHGLTVSPAVLAFNYLQQDTAANGYKLPEGKIIRLAPKTHEDFKREKTLPDSLVRKYNVDSSGRVFSIGDKFSGKEASYPYQIDLDKYLEIRKHNLRRQLWDSIISRYDLQEALSGGDLARMLAQSTGLSIPVPPNPVISIFGKPEISINVSGEVNLRMGWRWDTQNLGTVSAFGQSQSTPIFDQDIRVRVDARIGDKLKFGTDWNTRRQFDHENEFKVGYEGEDDEIIKLLEVGNVSLPLNSTLIGGGEALFGVRGDFQFGPLYLKTIASQRRGERKFVEVTGGSSKQPFYLRAYDYAQNHFFLDTLYKEVWKEYFKFSTPIAPSNFGELRIKEIEVFESTNTVTDVQAVSAKAFANLEPQQSQNDYPENLKYTPIQAGQVESGRFLRLDSNRYKIDRILGHLTIYNRRPDRYYAVAYRTEGPSTQTKTDDLYHGQFSSYAGQADTLILKLIYRPNMQPGFRTLWDRQMKNIYSINATSVNTEDTEIGVWYINQSNDSSNVLPGAPDKLVTILRVDQVSNSTGSPPGDGQFDLTGPFFNALRGEITFPSLEPFRDGLRNYFADPERGTPQLAEQYIFGEVYDTTYDIAKRNTARDRFVIAGEVSGKATNRIPLGAFNLAENSVKVTLDGVPLREYEDYVVDYYSGILTLRNPRATLPNANLKIEYEQNDIFNISTRTLLGIRGDYELYKGRRMNAGLGFTAMHYDQSIIQDRVRLGDEPVSNTMLGFDGSMKWDTPWMTKLLSDLPFYDTKAPSSMSLRGEWAMILPGPNKRTSEVLEDNNEPVVYIDDFEGAQKYISLGLSPTQWQHSSQPVDSSIATDAETRSNFRSRYFWYQHFIPRVPIEEVYPNRSTIIGNRRLSPLEIDFDPRIRGIYNWNPEFIGPLNPNYDSLAHDGFISRNKPKFWGGMQRLLSAFNTNFDAENIEYIEIMLKLDQYEPGSTKMYVDLGYISEDIIPNNVLNTEDGSTAENPLPNNIIDENEDKGLDNLNNAEEKASTLIPAAHREEDDPSRDDYFFNFQQDPRDNERDDFVRYNNFEGNATISETGQFPDTEILNKNNGQTLFLDNSYFSYEVNLFPDPNLNPQIVGGPGGGDPAGWYLYRIPVRKPSKTVGNPSFSNIQYIRVWYKGGILKAKIADWRLVGSHWERQSNVQSGVPAGDSVLQISFVNREENDKAPDFYTMPPGVKPPRQLNSPDPTRDIRLNEQSLALSVKNLPYCEERMAARFFRELDLFYYKKLKFFIHGDGTMPDNIVKGASPKAYAFLRFGIDSSNYYEYRTPLLRGWQSISIPLEELTAVKRARDTSIKFERQEIPVPGSDFASYAIKGNPILTRVQYFGFGVSNPCENFPEELTTTMWVNELRLLSPEQSADWSAVANADIQLADLGKINASAGYKMPNFHRIEERFGNRVTSSDWSVSAQANLEKFAPKDFKSMKIPITYTHTESNQDPEFVANNDINLDEVVDAAINNAEEENGQENLTQQEIDNIEKNVKAPSQTLKVQDSWALTGVRLGIPSDSWLIKETLNNVAFNYSYSQVYERNPVVAQRFYWIWKMGLKYNLNLGSVLTVKPFSWAEETPVLKDYSGAKINFLPNNFSTGLDLKRSRTTEQSRFLPFPSPVIREFTSLRDLQFTWRIVENGFLNPSLDYQFNTTSTLVPLELNEEGKQREGSDIARQMFLNDGNLLNLGKDNLHTQTFNLNIKPKLPIGEYARNIDMTGTFNTTYNWMDPLQQDPEIRDIAKNASWDNNIRFNVGLRLQSMADQLFGPSSSGKSKRGSGRDSGPRGRLSPGRGPGSSDEGGIDSTASISSGGVMSSIGSVLRTIFLDYEKVDITFNQVNNSNNQGVFGGNGLLNFWQPGSGANFQGPSAAYQLGLVPHPHGGFRMAPSSTFPFFGFETFPGLRPPNAVLQDMFTQRTKLDMKTSRPLWEGAELDLTWSSELGYNKNQTIETDEFGNPTFTNVIALQSYNRTFMTFPTIFGVNVFNNNMEHVIELYQQRKAIIEANVGDEIEKNQALLQALSESFYDGLEAFSIFGGEAGKFLPAVNWSLRWEGIEKWGLWNGLAQKISLDHRYASTYQEDVEITDNGRAVQRQAVQYGFQPLIGLNMSFDEKKLDGLLTASLRYSTTSNFSLNTTNRSTIVRNSTNEFQLQASYAMENFSFDLLGIELENEVEASLQATYKSNINTTYDVLIGDDNEAPENPDDGRTLNGSTQIIIEPRIRYMMSKRVTASFFWRYEGTFNEGAAQPGFVTNQVGLDLRISIAGGR